MEVDFSGLLSRVQTLPDAPETCPAVKPGERCRNGWHELEVGVHILAILDHMRADEPRWRAMNPGNGWGDYDKCIQGRMRQWAKACAESPKGSTVGASL